MKSRILALSLAFATPALAADPEPGTPSQLCYSYASLKAGAVLRLIKPAINLTLAQREVPKKFWGRAQTCILGGLDELVSAVRQSCLVAQDPTALLESAFGPGVEPCFTELASKPVQVFPGEVAPPVDPEAKTTDEPAQLTGDGILPALRGDKK